MACDLQARLCANGPKRLLALDGGGIRGLLSVGYLAQLESILRERHDRPDLVLADYFDLIGGTSTGAIIATLLSLGSPIAEIRELYLRLGREAFQPRKTWLGPVGRMLGAKFDEKPLERMLREKLRDRELGSPDLRTGLMIVTKRADTGSVWPFINIPGSRFYKDNCHVKLRDLIRASTAAPTFFRPIRIADLGSDQDGVFIDGGVSMHNNPALQLLMVATLEGFGLSWPFGEDRLLLCSVGTGRFAVRTAADYANMSNLGWVQVLLVQMIRDAEELNKTILQWLSRSTGQRHIDLQIGNLERDTIAHEPPFTYRRYNIALDRDALAALGLHYTSQQVAQLRDLGNPKSIQDLDEIGRLAAERDLDEEAPSLAFDLRRELP